LKIQGKTFQILARNCTSRICTISSQICIMAEKLIYISIKRIIFLKSVVGGRLAFLKRPPVQVNPLNAELNPICYLLALLGAHLFLHVSRIRVKSLTLRQLMLYIYMDHLFLMFLDHTQRRTTVGRTPLDE